MKVLNIIVALICLMIIGINTYLHYDMHVYKTTTPGYGQDAQAGIGIAVILGSSWVITSAVSCILFIIVVVQGIRKKRIFKWTTWLVVALVALTFFTPPALISISDYIFP